MEKGSDCTPEGMPVSVPELIAAAVVDSLLAAAMAAMFEATGLLVFPADAAGVLGLIDEAGESELLLDAELPFEPTSCPADVGNVAEAPAGAEEAAGVEAGAAAGAAAGAVDPRRGTEAAAPVDPVLM